MLQTLRQAAGGADNVASARLNPNFRYLRLTIAGRVVLLALGYEDVDSSGPVEVWYSAEREVLRLQNGRLVGATGLTTEWRSVSMPALPSWSALARSDQAHRWNRVRDVMPGYRLGVRDAMSVRVVSQPRKSDLQGLDPQGFIWFEERLEAGGVDRNEVLPPARYAVEMQDGKEVVVYGEQCLEKGLCFSWQRWPVQEQSVVGKR